MNNVKDSSFHIFQLILVKKEKGTEVNTEPTRATKMQLFAKIVNGFQMQSIFAKSYILDVRLGSGYASDKDNENTWVKKLLWRGLAIR